MYGYQAVLEATGRGGTYEKRLCLRPLVYSAVKELITEIGRALPEQDGVVPCYIQSEHMNLLGSLQFFGVKPE